MLRRANRNAAPLGNLRRWPTRAELLRDACSTISTPQEALDTGTFETDIIALMTVLAQVLRTAKWTAVLPSIIDAAECDPDIAAMYSKLQRGYAAPLETATVRAMRRGELPENTDIAMLTAACALGLDCGPCPGSKTRLSIGSFLRARVSSPTSSAPWDTENRARRVHATRGCRSKRPDGGRESAPSRVAGRPSAPARHSSVLWTATLVARQEAAAEVAQYRIQDRRRTWSRLTPIIRWGFGRHGRTWQSPGGGGC